jgi:TolB-like protein/Tfp pilus assembly protein PilF
MGLIAELRRRNVFRMAALYVVAAWLVMQVAEVVIGLANLPDWLGPAILVLLAIGLPIALIFSWFFEITPEGLSLEKDVSKDLSITHVTGRRMDFVIIAILSAGLLLFAYDKWWPREPLDLSIAVLPFENVSDDPGNEYFADGVSEEIINLLVKVPDLIVISRNSAFSFKGQNVDTPTIAARLNVSHILEGSVRKSGDQLRITAQLIEVRSDRHLWSKTFDRELKSIFAIQDDIAAAVVKELQITLKGERLTINETTPDAYALYLQARHVLNFALEEEGGKRAETLLQQALVIDPDFAPAWSSLSEVYALQALYHGRRPHEEGFELSRDAAQRALALDPQNGPAYAALTLVEGYYDLNFKAAYQNVQKALAIEPSNSEILWYAGTWEAFFGRLDEAIRLLRRSVARDPLLARGHYSLGNRLWCAHRLDEAEESFQMAESLSPGRYNKTLRGLMLLAWQNAPAALEVFEQMSSEGPRQKGIALAKYALGDAEASDAALQDLIEIHEMRSPDEGPSWAVEVAEVYAFRDEADKAFEWLVRAYQDRDPGLIELRASPLFANLHDDPRWGPFLDKIGLTF